MLLKINEKITSALNPEHLEVIDESAKHHVSELAISHLKVVVVSKQFEGMKLLKRHQLLYALLKEEMKEIHALSLHLFTEEEWKPTQTPNCLGK